MVNLAKQLVICTLMVQMVRNVIAAPRGDEITGLPGWSQTLPSKQYSGYLDITPSKHYHYWFVECENNPESAPVVLWLNGGPGCSSLIGFMYEHGPFRIDDSKFPQSLYRFDNTWSKLANMIYLESPVGTGFTYSDNVAEYCNSDNSTVHDNFLAIEKFFELFPEFKGNNFYLTGESYAGIYVPTLAEAIIEASIKETYNGAPLKGIAVGNGCTGTEVGVCKSDHRSTFQAQFYVQNTAFLKQELKDKLEANCDWNTPYDISDECESLMQEANTYSLGLKDPYDIYSRENSSNPAYAYLNEEQVQEAIHVKKANIEWKTCDIIKRDQIFQEIPTPF